MLFRAIIFIIIAVAVAIIGYNIYQLYPSEPAPSPQEEKSTESEEELDKSDLIRVESPRPNETIASPLLIKGEARGYWFFEADFPVKLLDGEENLITLAIATAKSDWMTENFVPFEATLEFENPGTEKGTLIFEKDNPSDLPEHDDELIMPVYFQF